MGSPRAMASKRSCLSLACSCVGEGGERCEERGCGRWMRGGEGMAEMREQERGRASVDAMRCAPCPSFLSHLLLLLPPRLDLLLLLLAGLPHDRREPHRLVRQDRPRHGLAAHLATVPQRPLDQQVIMLVAPPAEEGLRVKGSGAHAGKTCESETCEGHAGVRV
jgi:hypothetical protein